MNEEKIVLVSTVSGRIVVSLPEIRFNREWPRAGAKIVVDKDVFATMVYDPGVKYMLDSGMLYTEDMEIKKEFGLEPEDAKEPVNIVVLNDAQKKRALTVMPIFEFEDLFHKLSKEQKQELVGYAVDNNIIPDMKKIDLLQEEVNVNILTAINLKRTQEVK